MIKNAIHTEKSNKMQQYIKIYYSIFIWSSTYFGPNTVHHQEPKTALAASGLHTWKVGGRVVAGRCQASDDGRCVARNMLSFVWIWNNKFW
jgi:hypothetical protein